MWVGQGLLAPLVLMSMSKIVLKNGLHAGLCCYVHQHITRQTVSRNLKMYACHLSGVHTCICTGK